MEEKIIQDYPTFAITSTGFIRDLRTGRLHNGHNQFGYRSITLTNPNGKTTFLIHRLVALAFIPNPNGYLEIDHINRIKDDNRIENLRWVDDFQQSHNKGDFKNNKLNEKYICKEANYFRLQITRNKKSLIRKRFNTLEEAITYRDSFLKTV